MNNLRNTLERECQNLVSPNINRMNKFILKPIIEEREREREAEERRIFRESLETDYCPISSSTNRMNKLALKLVVEEREREAEERDYRVNWMRGRSLSFIQKELGSISFSEYFQSRDVSSKLKPIYKTIYDLKN